MPYDPPERDELREMVLADSRGRLPEMDVSDGSPEFHLHTVPANAAVSAVGSAAQLHRDRMVLYAKNDALAELASLYGQTKAPAVGAAGGTLRVGVTGTGTWLLGQQFVSADGFTYSATSGGSWTALVSTVDIPIDCDDTGAATTKSVNAFLTVLAPPAGMNASGWIQVAFTTLGRDLETDEEYRTRLKNLFLGSSNGRDGREGDFVRWMEEVDGVAEGYVYSEMRNTCSIDGTVFGPATVPGSRWVGAATVTAVENYINGVGGTAGQRASGQDFDCVLPTALSQSVDVTIDSDVEYGRDWGTGAGTSLNIDSIPADLMSIDVNNDPVAENMSVGDRIAVNTQITGAFYHCEVKTVTRIVGAGAPWTLHVDTPFGSTNTAGAVYPAGPTTALTVAAIEAAFDALGPTDEVNLTRWPLVSSEHPCDFNLAETNRRVMDVAVDGVRRHLNTSWLTPLGDVVVPTSLITGGVLVAYCIRLTTCRIRYSVLND